MSKRKYIRLALFSFLLVGGSIFIATKYINFGSVSAAQSLVKINKDRSLETDPGQEDELAKYEKPVYFSLFKFIGSFVPNRQKQGGGF